jgi:Ala-tRNA(Pro) deacylase
MPALEGSDPARARLTAFFAGVGVGTEGAVRPRSLDTFLKQARIPYTTFRHPEAFTAQTEAAVSHVPGHSWAKTVVCFADDEPILALVPAPFMVDFEQLRVLACARTLRLAREDEFRTLYPDCELGAMPPFGTLYTQRIFVDQSLVGHPEMVFNAGTHTDAIRMHYLDFADIAHPIVGVFGRLHASRVASAQAGEGAGKQESV